MTENKTEQLGFRVTADKAKLLEKLSNSTDRPRSWLLEQALDSYLEAQAWQIAHIEAGLTDADAGRVLPHDRIRDWLETWGSGTEGQPPE